MALTVRPALTETMSVLQLIGYGLPVLAFMVVMQVLIAVFRPEVNGR